jgi:trk system potassium uptake protein TrkA
MDAVVTVTNHDEVNVMVSMFASRQNVPKNITKIKNVNLAKLVDNISTDTIINPISTSIDIITHYIRAKKHTNSGEMKALYKLVDGKIEATEFIADSKTRNLGKPLSEIDFKKDILIASIGRKGKLIIPTGSETIQDGDKIIIVSKGRIIEKINDIFS